MGGSPSRGERGASPEEPPEGLVLEPAELRLEGRRTVSPTSRSSSNKYSREQTTTFNHGVERELPREKTKNKVKEEESRVLHYSYGLGFDNLVLAYATLFTALT